MMSLDITLKPIGFFYNESQTEPYQAGRQPDEFGQNGIIKLSPKNNFEQALQDLEGCSHLWLIFGFHQNTNWKPQVLTPRSDRKIGVFATRAPYRPNPIGLSCVKLLEINGLELTVAQSDLLDGTPIYDIKPYHKEVDSIPEATIDWLENSITKKHYVTFSPTAEDTLDVISTLGENGKQTVRQIRDFILRQLEYDPTNQDKKRVQPQTGFYTLSYRTFRVDFTISDNIVGVLSIYSGYTKDELNTEDDPYNDKALHRRIIS